MTAILDNVRSTNSTSNGGYAQSGSVKGTLRNCLFAGTVTNGVFADGTGGEVNIINCTISHNATGISVAAPAVVRLTDSTITNNTNSINAAGAAQVSSTGTNTITGNAANNLPAGPPIGQN